MKKTTMLLMAASLALISVGCAKSQPQAPAQETAGQVDDGALDTASEEASTERQPQDLVKVRAAYHPNLGPMTIPGIEQKMGFFKEEGLDVEWLKFTSGPPEIAAMMSGDIQFGYIGTGALSLCAQGQAEVISFSHYTNSEALLVRADSGITGMKDLEGKTVATEFGSNGEIIFNLACAKYDIDPTSINFINMPMSNAVAAFIGGNIDGIIAWGADLTNIKEKVDGELTTVVETNDFIDQLPFLSSWIAIGDYVDQNPEMAIKIIRALNKCYDYRYSHLDESIKAAADFAASAGVGVSYDELASERDQLTFFSMEDQAEWLESGKIETDFQHQLDWMVSAGKVEGGNVADYLRTDLMRRALEE